MDQPPVCQVCFTKSKPVPTHNPLIRCQVCKLYAHRYCYLPSASQNIFMCDPCKEKIQGLCYLCHNPGLLKKIGNSYAHPICLLFGPGAMVRQFSDLTFVEVDFQRITKKPKCDDCGISSSNVVGCDSKGCLKKVHIYCAFQTCSPENYQGWTIWLQPLVGKDNSEFITNLFYRKIKSHNKFLANHLNIKKGFRYKELQIKLYCQEHSNTCMECVCGKMDESKVDWVYCQGCLRWEHQDCVTDKERVKKALEDQNSSYVCENCQKWGNWAESRGFQDMPLVLPKLQLYDLILINTILEEKRDNSSASLTDLVVRVPILPGFTYADVFFKDEIEKSLRQKIRLSQLREKMEDLVDQDDLLRYLLTKKDKLELIWILTEDSIFGNQASSSFPYNNDEDLNQRQFINDMVSLMIKYDNKFLSGDSIFLKKIRKSLDSRNNQKISLTKKKKKRNESSLDKIKRKIKCQESSEIPIKKESDKMLDVCSKFEDLLVIFRKSVDNKAENMLPLFTELHKIMKDPETAEIIRHMPENIFTRSLLAFDRAEQSVSFMQFIGSLNYFQNQWKDILKNKQQPSPQDKLQVQEIKFGLKNLKLKIYYLEDNKIQKQILNELKKRQIVRLLPSGVNYQEDLGYMIQDWQQIPKDVMKINKLKELVAVKKINGQMPQRLILALNILEQLKKVTFITTAKEKVLGSISELEKGKDVYHEIIEVLQQYLLLYRETEKIIRSLQGSIDDGKCLMTKLGSMGLFQSVYQRGKHEKIFFEYLGGLKQVKLSLFSLQVQQVILQKIKHFLISLSRRKPMIRSEKELDIIKIWMRRMKVNCPPLQEVLAAEKKLAEKLLFHKLQFQNEQSIIELEGILKELMPIYQQFMFSFRVGKIQLVQKWIKTYYLILNKIPLNYLMNKQEWKKTDSSQKPPFEVISRFLTILNRLNFPDGDFKEKLNDIVRMTIDAKARFTKIMAGCNWSYIYGKSEVNWENKIPVKKLEDYMQEIKNYPLNLHAEFLQCEIVKKIYDEANHKAALLLTDRSSNHPINQSQVVSKVSDILQHLGASPLSSEYSKRLLNLLEQSYNPSKLSKDAELLFTKIMKGNEKYDVLEVLNLKNYFEKEYSGELDRDTCIKHLLEISESLQKCRRQFGVILDQFKAEELPFTEQQLENIYELSQQYFTFTVADRRIEEILLEYELYQQLMRRKKLISEAINKEQSLNQTFLQRTIKAFEVLHPCCFSQQLQDFSRQLLDLINKK